MIIATIKKLDGTPLDHGRFSSEEAANAWFAPFIAKKVYGQPYVPAREVPARLDEQQNELEPAYVVDEIPAEFSIEFAEEVVSQEEINREALAYLASTDWMIIREMEGGAACPEEIKDERADARERIVR